MILLLQRFMIEFLLALLPTLLITELEHCDKKYLYGSRLAPVSERDHNGLE